ncbi:MAG TPA: hypothetical protein VN697_03325 [Tepidiformaceae bacterium]|nr:hypothetical protein [Tepidiformaceae bacterium]
MPTTLGEALPAEMARVRDKVMPAYLEIDGALFGRASTTATKEG